MYFRRLHFYFVFDIDFCSIWARFGLPTWLQESIEIDQKSMPRGTSSWVSNFDQCLIDLGFQLGPSEPSKSTFFQKLNFLKKSVVEINNDFGVDFGQTWSHFASPNPPKKNDSKSFIFSSNFASFFFLFCSLLASKLEPCWLLKSPRSRPSSQNRPRPSPGVDFDRWLLIEFWLILDRF